jgi:hypothetical protein
VEWEVVELWLCCQLFGANSGKQRRTEVHVGRHRMDRQARIVAGEGKDMTDREMLELAAKAAGSPLKSDDAYPFPTRVPIGWNPPHRRRRCAAAGGEVGNGTEGVQHIGARSIREM